MKLHALRILVALAVFAAVFAGPAPGRGQETTVKIATIPIDTGAEVFYADDRGFFKRAGISAQIQRISNGPAIAAAVASGAVDIGFSNLVSIAIAYKRGVPVTLIAPAGLYSSSAPTSICAVALDSPIRTARDLNGKTFATNGLKNIGEFGPRAWIDANGGDSSTVKFVEMPFPEMPTALAQGRIDAALLAEPSATEAKGTTHMLSKCYDGIGNNYLIGAYFTTTTWANGHPDLVRRFQDAMRQTAAWSNRNHAATAQILAAEAKIDPQVAARMVRSVYPERLDPAQIQPVIDVTARYGGLPAPFPAADLIYRAPR